MTYIELCRELVTLFGIAGGSGPTNISGSTGELGNVTRWIRDAALDTDNKWEDWRYLWLRYTGTIGIGSSTATPPPQSGVRVRKWITHTLRWRSANPLGATWQKMRYVPFARFEQNYDPDLTVPGDPQVFTVMPDNTLQFDRMAAQEIALKGAFYRSPAILTLDADSPAMPAEYHRIIIVRALKYYADREDAPELVNAAVAEYPDLLEKLESAQLDAFRHRRSAGQFTEQAGTDSVESDFG